MIRTHRASFWTRRRKTFFAALSSVAVGVLVLAGITFWPWRVAPPSTVDDPGVAFIADYGRHSRLALQVDEHRLIEYSFGDWQYYAMGDRTLWRGIVGLGRPTQAGFGWRHLPLPQSEEEFNRVAGSVRSVRIEVERAKLARLLDALDARYRENLSTEIYSEQTGMFFVADDLPYHLFHNSNHQTARWLRALGCQVTGFSILSNYRLKEPDDPDVVGAEPEQT